MEVAKKQDRVFIVDTGEGNDYTDPITGWYIEDFSGWLVEISKENDLIKAINEGKQYTEFKDNYVFAKWSQNEDGKIVVKFVRY